MPEAINILYLCTGNSCRSQMAEGWTRQIGGDGFDVQSAGVEAHGKNPRAIAAMKEAGVDISGQESTIVSNEMLGRADLVVTVCGHADEQCPMLLKIDFHSLVEVRQYWKGVGVTLFINWAVKPFSMALLAWIFIRNLFSGWLPAEQLDSYIAGLILLAAAPCTAMVFVWSNLSDGHPGFTLSQVALNDLIMVSVIWIVNRSRPWYEAKAGADLLAPQK